MATVVLAGTFDTKGGEFEFARDKILSLGIVEKVLLVDTGIRSTKNTNPHPDIGLNELVAAADSDINKLNTLPKGQAIGLMSKGLTRILIDLHKNGKLHGVMGMGGGCGSTMLAPAFQQLPIGVPKLLISTMVAAGNVRPFIGCTDMTLMYSVTDFSGQINQLNRQIISNAAVGIAAMAADYAKNVKENLLSSNVSLPMKRIKPLVVASMLGGTQPCVNAAEARLDQLGYDVISFHSVGAGGEAMENFIGSGAVDGVLDITLMEITHHVYNSLIHTSGPHRLEAAGRMGIPQVVAPGALDLIVFGPESAIPAEYRTRAKIINNVNFVALRTSEEECTNMGKIVAEKLNKSRGSVTLFLPLKGLSRGSGIGNELEDSSADECLFVSLRTHIDPKVVNLIERDEHINDPQFAYAMVDALHEKLKHKLSSNHQ